MATTTRNSFFRELIATALTGLVNYDSAIKILYSIDDNKFPYCYIQVENEKADYESDLEGELTGLVSATCDIILVFGFQVKTATNSNVLLLDAGDLWIERIEYLLSNKVIKMPKTYTQVIEDQSEDLYEIDITKIEINKNRRVAILNNEVAQKIIINGKIDYDKTYV